MIAETTQALGGKMRRKKKVSNKKKWKPNLLLSFKSQPSLAVS
jgi:hypothetical protein